jgi:hypothetical protein
MAFKRSSVRSRSAPPKLRIRGGLPGSPLFIFDIENLVLRASPRSRLAGVRSHRAERLGIAKKRVNSKR